MTTRSLIKMLLFIAVGWTFILSPGLVSYWSILRNANTYRRAEFLVTGRNCIGGSSDGRGRTSSRSCFLEGKVLLNGRSFEEEFSVGSELPPDRPAGSRFAVYYNPTMPAFGMNYFNQRVLSAEHGQDPSALARQWLWAAARMILLSLGTAIVVHALLRIGILRLSHPPRQLAVDLGGGQATIGTFLFSLGLFFILSQIPDPAWGGIIFGLILSGAGAPFLVRHILILSKDEGRAARGYHFLGLPFKLQSQPLPMVAKVILEGGPKRWNIVISGPGASESIQSAANYAAILKTATRVADFFGAVLESNITARSDKGNHFTRHRAWPSTLLGLFFPIAVLLALVAGGILALDQVPSFRQSLATTVLDPFGNTRQVDILRRWALNRLVDDPSPEALLALLRLLNTVDAGQFPEVAADVDIAAARRAGLTPTPEQNREARIRAINQWASSHLRKVLDANGGILGWTPVAERYVDPIDAIASQDLNTAWITWKHFAAGDLRSQEQFLYAVGAALADPRPIHFAIFRSGTSFDSQPRPIESPSSVLAHSVGEALALQLWLREGAGDSHFPEDFDAWWVQWAHARRIPPPPTSPGSP